MASARWAAALLVALALLCGVNAYCPYSSSDNAGLVTWSSGSWNGGSAPASGADVTIPAGAKVLYDLSSGAFNSITVNGQLVFANSASTLTVAWIRVNSGGYFLMGDKTCKLTAKIVVTFTGSRGSDNPLGLEPSDSATLGKKGLAVVTGGTIELHSAFSGVTWTRLSATVAAGATTITVQDDVSKWPVGGKIAIASTDFGATPDLTYVDQSEDRLITAISGKTITLNRALTYGHWGAGNQYAEVGLCTRNIVFQGDSASAADKFGGHLLIREAANARIDGVEFTQMGQQGIVGRYPVHIHRAYDKVGQDVYVQNCAVHACFQRSYVLHDTNGVLFSNNVGYWTIGHMYFLEDGCELYNTFDHNLAIRADPVNTGAGPWYPLIVPTDDRPSMFWVTNPLNTYTGNAACGGEFGFWYAMPKMPNGVSATKYASSTTISPRYQIMGRFENNVAHSVNRNGVMIDDMQLPDGNTELGGWVPKQGPYDPNNYDPMSWELDTVPGILKNTIAYKCRDHGVWIRGGGNTVVGGYLEDNTVGILIVPGPNVVRDLTITGETDNIGLNPVQPNWLPQMGRSRPTSWTNAMPIIGWSGYDSGGPQFAFNIVFKNIKSNSFRPAGALGALMNGINMLHSADQLAGLSFVNSDKAYYPTYPQPFDDANTFRQWDGPRGLNFHDRDGSVTGYVGGWVVGNMGASFMIDSDQSCTAYTGGNCMFCPADYRPYVHVAVNNLNFGTTDFGSFTQADDAIRFSVYKFGSTLGDSTRHDMTGQDYDNPQRGRFEVNLRARGGYAMVFKTATPPNLRVNIHAAAIGEWVVWALPYASGTTFSITWGWDTSVVLKQAASLALLTCKNYYFDGKWLYLKVQNQGVDSPVTYDDFTGYGGYGSYFTIQASCSGTGCAASGISIPPVLSTWGTSAAIKEDRYKGTLAASDAGTGSLNSGLVFVTYNPYEKAMSYSIYHTIPTAQVVGAQFHVGSPASTGPTLITLPSAVSPIRGTVTLTYAQQKQLYAGLLYVHIHTQSQPSGEIRAQINCDGTCTAPAAIPRPDPCQPSVGYQWLFQDAMGSFSSWSWNLNAGSPDTANTDAPMACSTGKQIFISTYNGAFQMHYDPSGGLTPSLSTYAYLEFWARNRDTSGTILDLAIQARLGDNGKATEARIVSDYILNYAIDGGWTRVRVPLAAIGITSAAPTIDRIAFYQYNAWAGNRTINFYLDSIAFVAGTTETLYLDGGWSAWSTCSASCSGTQTRTCTAPAPSSNGAACTGATTQACNTVCATPVPGGWSAWASCPVACGGGTQTRSCTNPAPTAGGAQCSGSSSQACGTQACTMPVDGAWSAYSTCTATCGGTKSRTCTNPAPLNGGATCAGVSQLACASCSTDPVDGDWSGWTECSASCGTGSQQRTCTNPTPQGAGALCFGATAQACNTMACTSPIAGAWTTFGACSKLCDGGVQTRTCTNPAPTNGGAACSGVSATACNTPACLGGVTVSMNLAVDYSVYNTDQLKAQFNKQIVDDVAAALGVSSSQLSVTSVDVLSSTTVRVNFLLTSSSGSSAAALATLLTNMVSNSSSPLYDPERALSANAVPGTTTTGTAQNPASAASSGMNIGIIVGAALGGVAIITVAVVAYCCLKKKDYEKKKQNLTAASAAVQLQSSPKSAGLLAPSPPSSPGGAARDAGWTKVWDDNTRAHYWFNSKTNESVWTAPAGWVE